MRDSFDLRPAGRMFARGRDAGTGCRIDGKHVHAVARGGSRGDSEKR